MQQVYDFSGSTSPLHVTEKEYGQTLSAKSQGHEVKALKTFNQAVRPYLNDERERVHKDPKSTSFHFYSSLSCISVSPKSSIRIAR